MANIQDTLCNSFCELLWVMVSLFGCLHHILKDFSQVIHIPAIFSLLASPFRHELLLYCFLHSPSVGSLLRTQLCHILFSFTVFPQNILLEDFIKSQLWHCVYPQNLHHVDNIRSCHQLRQWPFEPAL